MVTKKKWGGWRGTPQKCQKQEPTGHQKGKCGDWGASQKGTQRGRPAYPWSSRTSAHLPSSWPPPWSPCLQLWPSSLAHIPTVSCCHSPLLFREELSKFLSPSIQDIWASAPSISCAQCSSHAPGPPDSWHLHQHPHSSHFHAFARAVSATETPHPS